MLNPVEMATLPHLWPRTLAHPVNDDNGEYG